MIKKCFAVIALLAMTFLAAQAQAATNFSGEWKLNVSKSDFGAMPAPDSRTDKIAHEDPDLVERVKMCRKGPSSSNPDQKTLIFQ